MSGKAGHLLFLIGLLAVTPVSALAQQPGSTGDSVHASPGLSESVVQEAIAGVKNAEHALNVYERIERVETRKEAGDATPQSVRVSRVVPAGTGTAKIPLGPDGKPANADDYRNELTKLLHALVWAAETGQPQREAYQRVQKKQKDRDDLIDATQRAFVFTYVGQESRGTRSVSRYRMEANRSFKSTNRATSIFSKVKGFIWVDDASHELVRVEGEVTEDISLGVFLAKVYKGSRFQQERHEMAPGLWLPSFSQYDFDGRKFFSSFGVHEKSFFSDYKRIGTPAEAIPRIQAEIAQLDGTKPKSAENR